MATKSKVAKKAVAKKSTPVKKVAKKAVVKKAAAKKGSSKKAAPAKKPVVKKVPAKKAATKTAVKKAAVKKAAAKPVSKKATPVKNTGNANKGVKKVAQITPLTKPAPLVKKNKVAQPKDPLPPVTELSEELVEKAANTGDNKPMLAQTQTAPEPETDPIQAFDKNTSNKTTSKGDPHSRIHLSKAKGGIKPSGKKPLW